MSTRQKHFSIAGGALILILLGYVVFALINPVSSAMAAKKLYSATLYIAGMGGHFAKADITIDPNNSEEPIKINSLNRVVIGTKQTHPTHDPRIDMTNRNILLWSTHVLDPEGKMHVGKLDLKAGTVLKDVALVPDKRSQGIKPPLYCASGQTEKYYMPVFMGKEGYVDVIDKATLELKHRLFVSDLGYKPDPNQMVHGTNSPDMKKFLVTINLAEAGKSNGKIDFILVDLQSLEKGEWKLLSKNTLTGVAGKTINFRQYFTNNLKYIFQAAGDRLWILDAVSLKLVDEQIVDGQIHDAMPTPDGKYGILTIRNAASAIDPQGNPIPGKNITDGTLKFYDFDAKRITGKAVSTCQACHKGIGLGDRNAILCGIDGNWRE